MAELALDELAAGGDGRSDGALLVQRPPSDRNRVCDRARGRRCPHSCAYLSLRLPLCQAPCSSTARCSTCSSPSSASPFIKTSRPCTPNPAYPCLTQPNPKARTRRQTARMRMRLPLRRAKEVPPPTRSDASGRARREWARRGEAHSSSTPLESTASHSSPCRSSRRSYELGSSQSRVRKQICFADCSMLCKWERVGRRTAVCEA